MSSIRSCIHQKLFAKSKTYSRKGLYEFLDQICAQLPDGIQVLNVGAGGDIEACLRRYASSKNWSFVSLDVDPKRYPDIQGSIENVALPDGQFYVVFMIEVLEHVVNITSALSNSRRMLSTHGKLVASIPFMLPIHDAPYDFYRFTEHGLARLFMEFSQVRILSRNGFFESCAVLAMRSLATRYGTHPLVLLVAFLSIYILAPLARVVDRVTPLNESTTGYTVYCNR